MKAKSWIEMAADRGLRNIDTFDYVDSVFRKMMSAGKMELRICDQDGNCICREPAEGSGTDSSGINGQGLYRDMFINIRRSVQEKRGGPVFSMNSGGICIKACPLLGRAQEFRGVVMLGAERSGGIRGEEKASGDMYLYIFSVGFAQLLKRLELSRDAEISRKKAELEDKRRRLSALENEAGEIGRRIKRNSVSSYLICDLLDAAGRCARQEESAGAESILTLLKQVIGCQEALAGRTLRMREEIESLESYINLFKTLSGQEFLIEVDWEKDIENDTITQFKLVGEAMDMVFSGLCRYGPGDYQLRIRKSEEDDIRVGLYFLKDGTDGEIVEEAAVIAGAAQAGSEGEKYEKDNVRRPQ